MARIASATGRPWDNSTSTWRSFATISSGLCFFCGIIGILQGSKSLLQGGPLFRGQASSAGGTYRYYTCSTKARQGKTGCEGRTIQMGRLDHLVVDHIEGRLLRPTRLETILSSVIDRRQERTERRREHLSELHRRITEADQRLGRLFDAIESGLVDKDDSVARDRIAGLKAVRDQAQADADRIEAALESEGGEAISTDMLKSFARKARERIRLEDGGYRRDHLRALAQRVEVDDAEARIMGSKSELLRTLVAAASGGKSTAFGVHSSVLKWRARKDSNL
ncbi:recombinase zinc beta ribbon domain-containing protein [Bosea sp. (in: a-proteobacteria)]